MSNSNWANEDFPSRIDSRDPKIDLRAPSKRKDTRRWCRGKRGVEHQFVVRNNVEINKVSWWPSPDAKTLCCKVCGKELARYTPPHPHYMGPPRKIPAWVTEGPAAYRGEWF
jgi:hypothetical protein